MKKYLFLVLVTGLIAGCGGKQAEPAKEEEEHHEEAPSNFVSLTAAQMKMAGIELGSIDLKNLTTSISANGMLTVPNQNKAFVTSLYSGVIRTLSIQPGSFVQKGQTIATIVNPEIVQLQQSLITVNAEIRMSEIEERRQRELVEGQAAPLKNLQLVQTRLKTLRAERAGVQKQLSTLGVSGGGALTSTLRITAPISGTVSTVQAQIGSNVDPSSPLAEIVNNSQLHLDLFVYEKDLPRLHKNQVIHFTLTNNAGKEYDAQIYSIGTAFAAATKTIPVHAVVKGDKTGLIEGMNITALISIGTSVLPAVPTDAIVSFGGQDYIFVQSDAAPAEHHDKEEAHDEKGEPEAGAHSKEPTVNFERVQVIKGASDVGYTEIRPVKELPGNARVITKGAFFVLAKMTNTGEHEH
ncbi:MAG: efflux RND transporter periplasmic adaptor subunit [Sphingobacteriales bacterium]|nr:MAG: efflux RND transporter periplasmic adaptor subunit [Sphingobacteriales bacterium]